MAIEKKNFIGGLNSDVEDRLVPNGDYRYALNVRSSKSDGASQGAIENTKGNTIVFVELPDGLNKVIGALDNTIDNTILYCVWNDLEQHSIFEYNATTSVVSLLLRTPLLNFKHNKYINDATIVGGSFFFNDRVNPPRSINIERARTNTYPSPFLEEFMNVIVKAPGFPPLVEIKNGDANNSIATNNIRNRLFQFRYKWVYLDDEQSAWSPISKLPLPTNETLYRPAGYYPLYLNNHIKVEVDLGGGYVKRVKIAVREGNTGDFLLAEDFNKEKAGFSLPFPESWDYDFYNDEVLLPIDNDGNSGMRLFDNVPQVADSMSQIDGNKIAFGGITEGYDPVDIDMDINLNLSNSKAIEASTVSFPIKSARGTDGNQGIDPYGYCWSTDEDHETSVANGYPNEFLEANTRTIGAFKYLIVKGQSQEYANPNATASDVYGFRFGELTYDFWWKQDGFWRWTRTGFPPNTSLVHDRALMIQHFGDAKGVGWTVSGSVMNEVIFNPVSDIGTRYVLKIDLSYYSLGYSGDNISQTKIVKLQYVTKAGDTSDSVAAEFLSKLNALQTLHEDYVDIRFTNSEVLQGGSWSYGNGAAFSSSSTLLRIRGEAYIPADKSSNDGWVVRAGPDTPACEKMATDVRVYGAWTLENNKTLKSGATHGFGIVYYDSENRSGLTNVSKVMGERKVYVPFFSERYVFYGTVPDPVSPTITIRHLAPLWAKRYQIVYTGNQTIQNIPTAELGFTGFVQFQLKLVNENDVPGGNSVGAFNASFKNLNDYNTEIPENSGISYTWNRGDRMRFITLPIGDNTKAPTYIEDYKDVEIISYDSTKRIAQFKDPGFAVENNMLVEVYTPRKNTEDPVYREIGESYPITGGLHMGNDENQSGFGPAKVTLEDVGDVYLKYRTSPVNSLVESYSYSDFYKSDSWNKGRPNIVDNNIKKTKRVSTIRFSNNYVPETNINGLSQFDDFNFNQYDAQYGDIQRMYSSNKDLVVFQNLKVGRVRVGQSTLYGNEGTVISTLKAQDKVLSDIVYYSGEFGIGKNPESFAVYGNRLYFVDAARGSVLRLSLGGDGLTSISEYGMHNYFTDTLTSIIDAGGDFKLFGEYDMRFDEYVLSIQGDITLVIYNPVTGETTGDSDIDNFRINNNGVAVQNSNITGTLVDAQGIPVAITRATGSQNYSKAGAGGSSSARRNDGVSGAATGAATGAVAGSGVVPYVPTVMFNPNALKNTIAFSEFKKRWCTYYSYVPEYLVSNNSRLLSFKYGRIYKHNDNPIYNNFYGEQFTSKLKLISNVDPSVIKVYNSVFLESNKAWGFPSISNQFGQNSSLITSDFVDNEGVFKSNFLKDSNTPNVTLPLIEGDELRCHSMTMELESTDTEEVKMFSVGVNLAPSKLTNK